MDTAQWPQEIVAKPMEEMVPNTRSKLSLESRIRRHKEQALNCPRCSSTNTKFCYYNNYSLSQPRYFCKTCRRYWTEGGSFRNIPVGGGSRKNKRSSSSSSSPSSSSSSVKKLPDLVTTNSQASQNPKIHEGQDLNLGFPAGHDFNTITELIQVPNFDRSSKNQMPSSSSTSSQLSALELLTGITSRGLNSFMPMPITDLNTDYTSGFALPEFRSSLNFSLEGLGSSGCGILQGVQETSWRALFPFEDLKQVSSRTDFEPNRDNHHDDSTGYWNGMLGRGSW